jgi:chemotaxis protein methyltransferase CheR
VDTDNGRVLKEAGDLYERGDYARAVRMLVPFAGRPPAGRPDTRTAEAIRILALSYANQGLLDEAESWCEAAIRTGGRDPALHYLLAMILQEQGHLAQARRHLETTLRLDREFILAHFGLAILTEQQGDAAIAHRHFTTAVRLLRRMDPADVVPESEGIPAGRLIEIIREQEEIFGVS